jgi:hypothetical protein
VSQPAATCASLMMRRIVLCGQLSDSQGCHVAARKLMIMPPCRYHQLCTGTYERHRAPAHCRQIYWMDRAASRVQCCGAAEHSTSATAPDGQRSATAPAPQCGAGSAAPQRRRHSAGRAAQRHSAGATAPAPQRGAGSAAPQRRRHSAGRAAQRHSTELWARRLDLLNHVEDVPVQLAPGAVMMPRFRSIG